MFRRFAIAAILVVFSCAAGAQELVLKAVSAFQEKTEFSKHFERWVEKVNADGKGVVQINYIGGPKAIPTYEVGNALKNGVVDVANTTASFYASLMPEGDVWKLAERPLAELRKNGTYEYMEKIYNQKLNAHYLARVVDDTPFHAYVNKPLTKPDFTGLKMRISPTYRDFFQAMGATVVQTAPGEVYTALERGVVDGYGWPISGIFDMGWQEKTKFRIDPGFYSVEVSILMNLNTWKKLTDAQRAVLVKAAEWVEGINSEYVKENQDEAAKQAKAGIKVIKFEGKDAEAYRAKAYDAAWDGMIKQSPEHGPKLKALLSKGK